MVFTKLTHSIVQLIRQHQNGGEPERTLSVHSGNKIIELESIRGVAALLVVLFHIPPDGIQVFIILALFVTVT